MKARILDNLGQSKYQVELLRDESQQAYVIARQNAEISTLQNEKIPAAEQSVAEAQNAVDSALSAYEAVQADYIATSQLPDDTEGRQALLDAAAQALNQSLVEISAAGERKRLEDLELATLQAELIAAKEQKKLIDQSVEPITIECWTSVWNDSLEAGAVVEVILMPGEPHKCVIHDAGITNDRLTPIIWQTPAQALFNFMMLPGWQRHQYRFGVAQVTGKADANMVPVKAQDYPSSVRGMQTVRDTIPAAVEVAENVIASSFSGGDLVLLDYDVEPPVILGWFEEPASPWIATYAKNRFMEFVAPRSIIDAILGEYPSIICEWRKDSHMSFSSLAREIYYEDGITWYDTKPYDYAYPSVTMQEYGDESYMRIDVDKYYDSSDYGTHTYRVRSTATDQVYMEVTIQVDAAFYDNERVKTSAPSADPLWPGSIPILPLD